MKVLRVAGVIALSVLILQAEDRQFSLTAFGVGPITLHTTLTHEGDGERLIATAKNESGTAIQHARICVRAFESESECLFELSNTALWAPGVELNWNLTTPKKLAKLPHYATIEQLDVVKTGESETASPHPALISTSTASASAQSVKEPEFPDVFYALSGGQLLKLERQEATSDAKVSLLMTAKGALEVPGPASPVRLKSGIVELVVRSPDSLKSDPGALYHIRKMASKKKSREVVLVTASPFGARSSAQSVIAFEFSRYGESSLKLTVAALPPGEYAVGRQHGQVVFCFGVD